ncbi:MAG: helix-turn-helix domain-containing protein [Campylobacteraceae bacterium]|jgi:transcriptional regulator with XRE-family HTH domain|nr:helix-turn-helix domain-containing protein [Campylobacteraceae bacterium]
MGKNLNEIGNIFKEIRKTLKLSQDEFCNKIGVSKRTYLRYESGERKAPVDIIQKIAQLGNTTIEQIIGDVSGDNNVIVSGEGNIVNSTKKSDKKFENLFNLIENYATPKLIEEFESKLLKIKEAHET